MGFFAGAGQTFAQSQLEDLARRRTREDQTGDLLARFALEAYLDPNTPPDQREQYRRLLARSPYAAFSSIDITESPGQRLTRELGPLLSAAQALGALGQVGLLTPEVAGQVEGIVGREFLPRREVTVPGLVRETIPGVPVPRAEEGGLSRFLKPAGTTTMEIREPPTTQRVIDISRLQPQAGIKIKLYTGEEVPVDALKGLSGDLQMYLIQGPQGRAVQTYGQLFGGALKPEWQNVPVQFDSNGSLKFPPEHSFVAQPASPTPTQRIDQQKYETQQRASARYAQVLRATGDPKRAWNAASEIDPITFRPELSSPTEARLQEERNRRQRAVEAFNAAVTGGRSQQEAYNAAFAIDPSFPAPATMARPGGGQDTTLNQVEKSVNDLRAEIAGLEALGRAGGDPDEMLLIGNQYVFRKDLDGIIAQRRAELRAREQQLAELRGQKPAGAPSPTRRAQQVLDAWKASGAPVPKRYWQRMSSAERKWLLQQGVKLEGL